MIEIANHELLGPELAMRGGTCMHKLHLPKPLRYSEDLDYVRSTKGGIGEYLDALRDVVCSVGLSEHRREFSEAMVHMIFDAEATEGTRRIRTKVETNTRETEPCFPRVSVPFDVSSGWWSGHAEITTFELDELLGTKLRALYQRNKGRDLFDLWYVLSDLQVDDARVIEAHNHYIGEESFTFHELASNVKAKLSDPEFNADIADLVATPQPNTPLRMLLIW